VIHGNVLLSASEVDEDLWFSAELNPPSLVLKA
jgi:hypothetical protein